MQKLLIIILLFKSIMSFADEQLKPSFETQTVVSEVWKVKVIETQENEKLDKNEDKNEKIVLEKKDMKVKK